MIATFAGFMLGVTIIAAQAALFGLLAVWLASRSGRMGRVAGILALAVMVWVSTVPILNRVGGYEAESALATNFPILVALILGWLSGRNRRLRAKALPAPESGPTARPRRLILDEQVRRSGGWVVGLTVVYAVIAGLATVAVELRIVANATGFWGFIVACFFAPVTFFLAPLYAGIRLQDWFPAALAYGGTITMWLGFAFGNAVAEDN